jgi:hypothetical protein
MTQPQERPATLGHGERRPPSASASSADRPIKLESAFSISPLPLSLTCPAPVR